MAEVLNLFNQAAPGLHTNTSGNSSSNIISAAAGGRTFLTLEVIDVSSWVVGTGVINLNCRVMGAGQTDAAAAFTLTNIAYTNLSTTTGGKTAGTTAITAAGLYEFDITNLECQLVYTRGNGTGSVGLRASITNTA